MKKETHKKVTERLSELFAPNSIYSIISTELFVLGAAFGLQLYLMDPVTKTEQSVYFSLANIALIFIFGSWAFSKIISIQSEMKDKEFSQPLKTVSAAIVVLIISHASIVFAGAI